MFRPKTWIAALASAACLTAFWTTPILADGGGERIRIHLNSGKVIEGVGEEKGDAYLIEVRSGIKMTIGKNSILRVEKLGPAEDAGGQSGVGLNGNRRVSDDEITEILGSETKFEFSPRVSVDVTLRNQVDHFAEIPINEVSRDEMLVIAGQNADWLATDHFVFVYTSETEKARMLGTRLEKVYEWVLRYMNRLGMTPHQPDYKLEIFFFGTHEEYGRFQQSTGSPPNEGTLGFYMPWQNRSAFFDMETWAPLVRIKDYMKQPGVPYSVRQKNENIIKAWVEHMNLDVVQHEAAHHIHFNVGVYNRRSDMDRWNAEGLASLFETPPLKTGGSILSTVNYPRLKEFRQFFGPAGQALSVQYLRNIYLVNNQAFPGFIGYSLGWSLHYYLWTKFPKQYGEYMRKVTSREDDVRVDAEQKLKDWEDSFGKLDEDWLKKFQDFMGAIEMKPSALPPDLP
ncbi:MAG: DUF1570 domain-containing protein [Phycisphaerales bacterium]|nr:DUF1570 domain-containing protein [Phycisphaerales bacterium]